MSSNKVEHIYIASTQNYIKNNIYKIGRTNNIRQRMQSYSTGYIVADKFFLLQDFHCYDSKSAEKLILNEVKPYLLTRETICCDNIIHIYNIIKKNIMITNSNFIESGETLKPKSVSKKINRVSKKKELEHKVLNLSEPMDCD